jgi:hypothetical protein
MLSVANCVTSNDRMVMNNEIEACFKPQSQYTPGRIDKTTGTPSQDILCPGRDSNGSPFKCKSEMLLDLSSLVGIC